MARKVKNETQEQRDAERRQGPSLIELTVDLAQSYVSRNQVPMNEMPALIASFYNALAQAASGAPAEGERKAPAVPVKKSVADDYIICLEDGKKLRMLKRYLRTHYDMSPEEYRKKWDLPHDYPLVAPAYARLRSAFAKRIGLGRVPIAGRGRRKAA